MIMNTIKSVLTDDSFIERFNTVNDFHYCLLLGGLMGSSECLFLPVEVPKIGLGDDRKRHTKEIHSIREVDEVWVGQHSKNLNRMTPGGVHISGICFAATLSEFNASQDHIRNILSAIRRKEHILGTLKVSENPEKIVMLYDLQSKKFTCKVCDTEVDRSTFRSVPVKQFDKKIQWLSFKTYISLSLKTFLPTDRKKDKILKHLQTAVDPYLQSLLTETHLLVNGEPYGPDELVLPQTTSRSAAGSDVPTGTSRKVKNLSSSKKQKKKKQQPSASLIVGGDADPEENEECDSSGRLRDTMEGTPRAPREPSLADACPDKAAWAAVDLSVFGPHFPQWQRVGSSSSLDSGGSSDTGLPTNGSDSSPTDFIPINRLVIHGRIPGIAFLPYDVSAGTLIEALRRDFVQSILARLQLLTDELHITGGELEVPRMSLPQRVLVRLPACPNLPLSDYKFLSETADDVVARLHYFCVPLGAAIYDSNITSTRQPPLLPPDARLSPPGADSGHYEVTDYGSSGGCVSSVPSSPLLFRKGDLIDASCLDTSLEKSPEGSADEFSDAEMLYDGVTQIVQPSAWRSLLTSPKGILIASVFLLLLALLLPYVLPTHVS